MPNDTDFTVARQAGKAGLNFAFLGRQFDYHAATATPANLDRGALQDMGEKTLASARSALATPPATDGRNLVYGQALGGLFVAYPQAAGWALLAAIGVLLMFAWRLALRKGPVAWTSVARGFGAFLYVGMGAAGLLRLARIVSGAAEDPTGQRWLLAQPLRWEVTLGLLAVGFVLIAAAGAARGRRLPTTLFPLSISVAACALVGGFDPVGAVCGLAAAVLGALSFGKAADRGAAWLGVLKAGALLTLACQILAPQTAFLAGWPTFIGALAAAATALGRRGGLAVMVVAAAASVGWLGAYGHLLFLGLDRPELLTIMAALTALSLWPLAQPEEGAPPARLMGPVMIGGGLVLLAFVRLDPPWSARHPQASFIQRHVDLDTGRAAIVTYAGQGPWSQAALGPSAGPYDHWQYRAGAIAAPTTASPHAAPDIALEPGADGLVRLRIAPIVGARVLFVRLNPDTPTRAVNIGGVGADFAMKPGDWSLIRWEGDTKPLDIVLKPGGPGRLNLRYAAVVEGWSEEAPPLPRRPVDVMSFGLSDSTVFTGSRRLAW